MFCSKCGKELSDEASFCGKCGAAVRREPPVVLREEVAPEKLPKKKRKTGLIILLVVLILALIAGGVILFFLYRSFHQKNIVGSWEYTFDISGLLGMTYEELAAVDMPLELKTIMTFREDGSYYYELDEETFLDSYFQYTLEAACVAYEQFSGNREGVEEYFELMNDISLKEYIRMCCEIEYETKSDDFSGSGIYTIKGNRVYYDGNETYDIFTVSGDTLTLELMEENAKGETFPGFEYPIVLQKFE